MTHIPKELLARYASGDETIPASAVWSLETHLEGCADCRLLIEVEPSTLDAVWSAVDKATAGITPAPMRRRWRSHLATWATPAAVPWLGMALFLLVSAVVLDMMAGSHARPLFLLLAPLVPVAGVAGVWGRRTDPAHEVVVATPRAGLYLVLRRTAAALAVVAPALAVAGWITGTSPALWLLPCAAFTVTVLALGSVVGVGRAAAGLAVLWGLGVVGPGYVSARLPFVLGPTFQVWWVVAVVVGVVVLAARTNAYAGIRKH